MRKALSVIVVGVLLVVLFAACGAGSTPTPTATETQATATATTPTETVTPTSTAAATATATVEDNGGGDAGQLADRASQAFKSLKSAHFDMTVEANVGDQTGTITATGDLQLPDRTHMTMNIVGMQIEVITIGTDAYTKVGDKWEKNSAQPQATDPKDIVGNLNIPTTAKRLADVNVDGTDCYHLQYTAKDIKDTSSDTNLGDVTFDVYIAKNTDLVKKMVIVPQTTGDQNVGATITMNFSKYNEPVNIVAPI